MKNQLLIISLLSLFNNTKFQANVEQSSVIEIQAEDLTLQLKEISENLDIEKFTALQGPINRLLLDLTHQNDYKNFIENLVLVKAKFFILKYCNVENIRSEAINSEEKFNEFIQEAINVESFYFKLYKAIFNTHRKKYWDTRSYLEQSSCGAFYIEETLNTNPERLNDYFITPNRLYNFLITQKMSAYIEELERHISNITRRRFFEITSNAIKNFPGFGGDQISFFADDYSTAGLATQYEFKFNYPALTTIDAFLLRCESTNNIDDITKFDEFKSKAQSLDDSCANDFAFKQCYQYVIKEAIEKLKSQIVKTRQYFYPPFYLPNIRVNFSSQQNYKEYLLSKYKIIKSKKNPRNFARLKAYALMFIDYISKCESDTEEINKMIRGIYTLESKTCADEYL